VATILFALAALVTLSLAVLDLVVLRGLEPREGDPPLVPTDEARDGKTRLGALAAFLLGAIGFPGTLAPVVLTVLAFQAHPITTDGWVALLAVLVASFSMSAAVKSFRVAQLLGRVEPRARRLLGTSVIYVLLWALLVAVLVLLARSPHGLVAVVVWSYVGVLLAGTAVVGLTTSELVRAAVRKRVF
jgi:hypothetical protein